MTTLSPQQIDRITQLLAKELKARPAQVQAAVALLDGGATVPFIARYRKEATDGLDDVQLRELEVRLAYLRELEERRTAVLKAIDELGKLTPELTAAIASAATKQTLEDLYAPFKTKRRTKAMIAREAGLEPLADALLLDPTQDPAAAALPFINAEAGFADTAAVQDGVRDLLAERWAEDAALVGTLRDWLWAEGLFVSKLADGKDANHPDTAKFRDYFDYAEPIHRVPSHRALAVFRGRGLELLNAKLTVDEPTNPKGGANSNAPTSSATSMPAAEGRSLGLAEGRSLGLAEGRIAQHIGWQHLGRPADELLRKCVGWAWRVKLSLSLERDLFLRLREDAEGTAIKVFADNVRDLLLAAPAGKRVVMGLDPGIRTGVKVAVVSSTGRVEGTSTVYPHEPRKDWEGSLHTLATLVVQHSVNLIAIGNGTASRETDKLAADLMARIAKLKPDHALQKVVVSEAGASVYSASSLATQELPDLDVSLRGAVSIARRVQDPLAELVKIDPKSIGVGQYQHDVSEFRLARSLTAVVEDCVNAVGVDLNTASVPLLTRVSGLSSTVAESIVRWRDANGRFAERKQLRDVPGLGPKTFEQAAGFLRIPGGSNPLDASGVHPETYPVVEKMLAITGKPIGTLMGAIDVLRQLRPDQFADEKFGVITVQDIITELEKPGRDPRPDFKVAKLNDAVHDIKDLVVGMQLEGTVTNVAQFGAFVDLGVHQDGLVHVSQLANKFVKDAREIVKTGDIVSVRVVEVDLARKRIALTMRSDAPSQPQAGERNAFVPPTRGPAGRGGAGAGFGTGGNTRQQDVRGAQAPSAMSAAFAKLKLKP